ncbi:hypothetical protein PCANC_23342 [Puccinia coronata f. sp. avenae]|uniref:Uncharacterized protein n=1 Tax=Puccinia coronata f. sp. avenae TaxID=200324 RepID=A0A2N5SC40_9BASI|nr:hypothetical protein PCANC_23342 [Puccinia coronata f. sp. avenae]
MSTLIIRLNPLGPLGPYVDPAASLQLQAQLTPSHIRSTNLTGGLRTLTAYAGVPYDKPATTISNSDDQSVLHSSATGTLDLPGLFENRGFCLGHINLDVRGGGSVMVIWRLARRRRARLPGIRIFVLTLDKFLESNDNSWVAMQPLKTKNGHFQTASLLTKHLNIPRLMDFRLRFTFSNKQARTPTLGYIYNDLASLKTL